jgi:hypothetical protein
MLEGVKGGQDERAALRRAPVLMGHAGDIPRGDGVGPQDRVDRFTLVVGGNVGGEVQVHA